MGRAPANGAQAGEDFPVEQKTRRAVTEFPDRGGELVEHGLRSGLTAA
jgi:hypothetical protein